ncbi:MAG: carboxylesterase family protein [Acidobacteriota bacterium]|nr:carboxylesterase family protein [Acidobacteriota bacterium]
MSDHGSSVRRSRTPPHADIEAGRYEGVWQDDVAVFRGIRYAAPPTGKLRWAPPRPPERFTGTASAAEFGPACPQPPDWDAPYRAAAVLGGVDPAAVAMEVGPTDEDCLSLNIWAPKSESRTSARAVMLWIHGGASAYGSGGAAFFDGTRLAAEQGVVVVTINYRLGALGFMAHPDLVKESPLSTAGNYGFLDQVRALEWVRDNISAFGGDPQRVTVIGESAGGRAVFELLAHPPAKDLFQRAIAQSAWEEIHHSRRLADSDSGIESALELGRRLAAELGLDGTSLHRTGVLEKLRAIPADEIIEAASALGNPALTWGPVVDGVVFPDHPLALLARGEAAAVPLLAGFNSDEGSIFFLDQRLPLLKPEHYRSYVESLFPEAASEILGLYPASDDKTETHRSLSQLYGDRVFVLPALLAARSLSQRVPVYLYRFTHIHPSFADGGTGERRRTIGSFHGSEIPLVFGTAPEPLDETDEHLGETMRAQWGAFVRSGTPNADGLPPWSPFEEGAGCLELGNEIQTRERVLPQAYSLLVNELACRIRLDIESGPL